MGKKYIFLLSIIVIIFSCVEKYEHSTTGNDDFLIVEGTISNLNEPNEILLSRSTSLKEYDTKYETNALVMISDQHDVSITLDEISPGKYQTDPEKFVGQIGDVYELSIYTSDGEIYKSELVTLESVLGIDSIYFSYLEEYNSELSVLEKGIEINISTSPWDEDDDYFLKWDYEETWKVFPTYSVMNSDIPHIPCYNIEKSNEIIMDYTGRYTSNRISKKKIIYLSEDDVKPYFGYSILIKQMALNEYVYQFWNMLEENMEENGDIFDKIPYNARSNIYCVTNDDKKVFGYFNASEIVQKRISFKPPLYGIYFNNIYNKCNLLSYSSEDFQTYLQVQNLDSTDVYIYDIVGGDILFLTNRWCVDCSVNSTTTDKPDYWPYD